MAFATYEIVQIPGFPMPDLIISSYVSVDKTYFLN